VASYQAPRAAKDLAVANLAVTVKVLQDDGRPVEGLRQPIQVFTDQLGQASIEFQLPRYTPAGPARLEIRIGDGTGDDKLVREIPLALAQPNVEFFPEGGDLLADVPNTVYFRATTSRGESADVEGRVVDSHGQTIAQVRTEPHDAVCGLGVFTLTPRKGESYRLQISSPAGAKESPALPAARDAGAALHVENPVDVQGEPVRLTIRSAAGKQLLLVASCRERIIAQQFVTASAGTLTTSLAPATGAEGTLRVTAYEVGGGRVTPLAERLVYREPARRLALSATTDKFAYFTSEAVRMKVYTADENGAATPAWLAALVVDERVLPDDPSVEQSMPAYFYLLSEVGQARDLDNADILLAPGDQARRALDLFLGTHGWRHFVPATAKAEKLGWFHHDNRDALLLSRSQAVAHAQADLKARQEQAVELRDQNTSLRDRARLAYLDLIEFEQQPRQMLGIGLGILVAALLLLGAGLLLWGLAVLMRGGAARPHFLVAMALLGCCFMALLAFGNRPAAEEEPAALAWLQGEPRPVPPMPPPPGLPPPPSKSASATEPVTRSLNAGFKEKAEVGGRDRQEEKASSATKDTKALELAKLSGKKLADWGLTTYWGNSPYSQNFMAEAMAEPLLERFNEAKLQQEATRRSGTKSSLNTTPNELVQGTQFSRPAVSNNAPTGGYSAAPPPVVPVSPTPTGDMKGPGGLVPPQLDGALKQREYAHRNSRKGNDSQDTVFWHPALVTQGGEVQVTFDLSSVPTSYRVLLYGHTSDGRLGGFQGRLTTRSTDPTHARKR
jgi:hypothetical protein